MPHPIVPLTPDFIPMTFRPALVALALAGCASADQVQKLEKEVAELKEKVETLEKAKPAGPAGAAPLDEKAEAAAKEIADRLTPLLEQGKLAEAKAEAVKLKPYENTQVYKRLRKSIVELEIIGNPVPADWATKIPTWYQGKEEVDFMKGTTLVVFWEVWCPHCKREVPKLAQTYTDMKGKGLKVVGLTKVTRSATEESVKEFIKTEKVNYPTAKEDGSLSTAFSVSGIPAAVVVKDGVVVWRGHPARLNNDILAGML